MTITGWFLVTLSIGVTYDGHPELWAPLFVGGAVLLALADVKSELRKIREAMER